MAIKQKMAKRMRQQAVILVKHFAKIIACIGFLALGLSGCDKLNSSPEKIQAIEAGRQAHLAQQMKSQHTLTRGIYHSHFEWDPHFALNQPQTVPLRDLLEGLVSFNVSGDIEPAVAQSWFSEDNQKWLFILNTKTWSNGEKVTAQDFVASWQRLVDPKNHSPLAIYLTYMGVKNAKFILAGKQPISELGVKALNDTTLEIVLEKPNSQLPKMLAHISLLPTFHGEKPQGGLISNGAYEVETAQENVLRLKTRDENHFFQRVEYQLSQDEDKRLNVDLIENPTAYHQQNVLYLPRLCTYFYAFNFNDPLLQKQEIRRAIKAMVFAAQIKGQQGLLNHYVIPRTMRVEAENKWSPIVVEQLLAQMGISPTNPLRLKVVYDNEGQHPQIAMRIIRALSQSDLMRVEQKSVDWKTLLEMHQKQDYHLIRSGWCADYNDAAAFLWQFHSQSQDNKNGYRNAEVDKALEQLQKFSDNTAEREQLIQQIAQQLENDIAILPLFQYQRKIVATPDLVGIELKNASEVIYSKHLSRLTDQSKENDESTHRTTAQ